MPIYYPPLSPTAFGDEEGLVVGGDVFGRRSDLLFLRHAAVQSVLGITGGSATPDDADAMQAVQAFRPQQISFSALQSAALRSFLGFTTGSSVPDDADAILAGQVFGP